MNKQTQPRSAIVWTSRFALQSHGAFEAAAAMRFSLEHQNPLVAGRVAGGGKTYPEKSYSLVKINNPEVLLWSLKLSGEGIKNGIIARVWNVAREPRRFSIALASGIDRATRTTHIETDLANAEVPDGVLAGAAATAQEILTFRLYPGQSSTVP